MTTFYEQLGFTDMVEPLNKKLDKKMFYEHGQLSSQEQKLFSAHIDRIMLSYLWTSSTVNIQPLVNDDYRFESIMFITITLRDTGNPTHIDKISSIIQRALPNPVVLVFNQDQNIILNTVLKRLNKVDNSKVVLEDIHRTEWFELEHLSENEQKFLDTISFQNLSFVNFFECYKQIDAAVETLQFSKVTGEFKYEQNEEIHQKQKLVFQEIEKLGQEIQSLTKLIKKETQFNKKAKYNMEIHNRKQKIEQLKNSL